MAISFRDNLDSIVVQENLSKVKRALAINVNRLSSGLRINNAADDPSGLAMSAKFKAQIQSIGAAQRNANEAISMIQTADGTLEQTQNTLTRMRELAVESQNGTLNDAERQALHDEFDSLRTEIDRLANTSEFNGKSLLTAATSFGFQVGINNTTNDQITITTMDANVSALGTSAQLNTQSISTVTNASGTITVLDEAIQQVAGGRSKLGAGINRLTFALDNLSSYRESLSAANSSISDADIAQETAEMTRNQILMQAGTALLAQANVTPATALQLLKGLL